jgi:hypothetical protein
MLNPFVRDSSYFQIIRNSNQLVTGYIFDNEFNKIINYINNKLLPILDSLSNNQIAGVLDSDGYLLRNIGDGSTQFNRLRGNDIPNGIITYDRFARIVPNSIIYCNRVNLNYISTNDEQSITIKNNANNCSFGKIAAINITDNTITNDKIALGTLTAANLDPTIINLDIALIQGTMIQDNVLTGINIADEAVSYSKMSAALIGLRNADPTTFILTRQAVTGLANDAHMIKVNMIAQNSIPFGQMYGVNQVLTGANLPIGTLSFLPTANVSPYSFNTGNLFNQTYIFPHSFTPNNNGVAANGINKYKLDHRILAKLKVGGLV